MIDRYADLRAAPVARSEPTSLEEILKEERKRAKFIIRGSLPIRREPLRRANGVYEHLRSNGTKSARSNGVRDYFRGVARAALAQEQGGSDGNSRVFGTP